MITIYTKYDKEPKKMSVLSNMYRNKPWVRPLVLLVVGAALGAGSVGYIAPAVLPILHEMLCNGQPGCSGVMPTVPPIPEKP